MYVVKYALKSIRRSIGRNVLIGIIVLIIAVSACVAMSIQQAAENQAAKTLEGMSVTGQLNIDKDYAYTKAVELYGANDTELMAKVASLNSEYEDKYAINLDRMKEYSELKKSGSDNTLVKDYYYKTAVSVNGNDIEKYDPNATTTEETTAATEAVVETQTDPQGNVVSTPQAPVMQQPEDPKQGDGDFSLVGYSSREAMDDFGEGDEDEDSTCTLVDGDFFADNTSEYVCLVEDSLSSINNLSVGDTVTIVNHKNENETYDLKIVGTYNNTSGDKVDGVEPQNVIITSAAVVEDIESKSEETNAASTSSSSSTTSATEATTSSTDSDTSDDDDTSNALSGRFTGTFVFGSVDDYNDFKEAVKSKLKEDGQDETLYVVTSSGIAAYKQTLKPLENLKSFATTFLYLTLAIGAIVLIVISVISIRDRKYEIGALAAMGMKKLKLAFMFMVEVLTVTLIAILIGAAIGSVASVPVTNYLLTTQVQQQELEDNTNKTTVQQPGAGANRTEDGEVKGKVDYVKNVEFSVDLIVILKMLAIGVGLAVVSGFTSILFILRYDPKQILASRD